MALEHGDETQPRPHAAPQPAAASAPPSGQNLCCPLQRIGSASWRGASQTASLVTLLLIVPCAVFIFHTPESVGLLPNGAAPEHDAEVEESEGGEALYTELLATTNAHQRTSCSNLCERHLFLFSYLWTFLLSTSINIIIISTSKY